MVIGLVTEPLEVPPGDRRCYDCDLWLEVKLTLFDGLQDIHALNDLHPKPPQHSETSKFVTGCSPRQTQPGPAHTP